MVIKNMPPQVFSTDSSEIEFFEPCVPSTSLASNKPTNGLWTATYRPNIISEWVQWCRDNDFKCGKNHFLIIPKQDIQVFCPTDISDLKLLDKSDLPFPAIVPLIDYGWYAEQYDGFHYDGDAWKFYVESNGMGLSYFHCWDCESTVWFNYNWIDSVKKLEV